MDRKWFCSGRFSNRVWCGCVNDPSNKCGTRVHFSVEHLVDHMKRCTPAYYEKMSHFIALVASIFCDWTVPLSRDVLTIAISTVPAASLVRSPLLGLACCLAG